MLSARQLTSQLLRRKLTLPYGLMISSKAAHNWGNYDVTPGQCCRVRQKESTKCLAKYSVCKPADIPNKCVANPDDDYSKQLLQILRPNNGKCDLFKHDARYYKPSDKRRRYQRTWPECPMPRLQPKKVCCYDKEKYPPMRRRTRPPARPSLNTTEKHAFQMALLCKNCKAGSKIKEKCVRAPKARNCVKKLAPFPSYSECDKKCIQRYCPTECGCRLRPSMCEMWSDHHGNSNYVKKCTEAIVGYCPFKKRARFSN